MLYSKKLNGIEIEVESKGAELKVLKRDGQEFMWDANPKYWGKTSPVLFPFVGGSKDNKYSYEGVEYPMGRHGFARDNEFELVENGANNLKFLYKWNEESLKVYPFKFEFYINYVLTENGVNLEYTISNKEEENLYFSLGTHPAFALDKYDIKDYYIEFSEKETLELYILDGLTVANETKPFLNDEKVIKITEGLFANDALVFKNPKSDYLSIKNIHDNFEVKVSLKDFPWLGIWAPEGASFLCLEPWCGVADFSNHDGNLVNKVAVNKIAKGEEFKRTMEIIVKN
ncbi:MAG: aldose 1-epimerase family protein [Fusobacteriaceae bacterium]|nr:aldose 1-epimerase family protein [Fusobacteriaceae bacterium]MBN2838807.1 aldose 1-epimerase family protein [Fusobacteriaceae bacterium]